jgi:hypothetical protein
MTTPPLADVRIRSAEELTAHWTALLDPPTFSTRALWLMWLEDDGRPLPVIIPVEDMPRLPSHGLLSGLLSLHDAICAEQLSGSGHLALALCRPGRPEITDDDDAWVDALSEVLDDQIDGTWSLHLAAGGTVTPLVELRR